MKNKLILSFFIGIFLIGSVCAGLFIDFYYSPTCPHCENVIPLINSLSTSTYDSNWKWGFYDITKGSYNIEGVPTLIFDNSIKLQGDYEIQKYAECYLKEQSSIECPTYTTWNCTTGWFIRE